MKDEDKSRVKNWKIRGARLDPDTDKVFQQKLKEKGDSQSSVIRKAVRKYNKD